MGMRYGVNPHQKARVGEGSPETLKLLNGSPSYINVLDALNAWPLLREARAAVNAPVAASFKHVSPAGVAVAGNPDETMREVWGLGNGPVGPLTSAYVRARDADPKCSFGDMIAVSEPVDLELAEFLARVISDGIVAPGFEDGALEILSRKKKGAFLVFEADPSYQPPQWERREVFGMVLEQEQDALPITDACLTMAEGPELGPEAVADALLGMITVRYTQSNSVAYLREGMTLGIGAGQQSRVDCTKLAGAKAANWWMRRNPAVRELALPDGMGRQDRLNWQIRYAEGDMTAGEWAAFAEVAGPANSRRPPVRVGRAAGGRHPRLGRVHPVPGQHRLRQPLRSPLRRGARGVDADARGGRCLPGAGDLARPHRHPAVPPLMRAPCR